MKKLFKGFFVTTLAVTLLAGCKPKPSSSTPPVTSEPPVVEKHIVEFYEDNLGKFYLEVEVEHGEKVARPADPAARKDYDFSGWWVDEEYSAEFDFDTAITKDTSIYGKWTFNPPYEPDDRTFHVTGALNNTDLDYINWNDAGEEGVDWDVRSYLTKAEDSNLYSIELEIGYLGKFKVKIPGRPWDSDLEFDFTHIREEDLNEDIQEGDLRNIQIINAGLYKIEVESTYKWARVTRLGDATGDGVRPNPVEGEVADWGIVGDVNNWGNPDDETSEVIADFSMHYNESGDYYYYNAMFLPESAEFKLRADNSWGEVFGPKAVNVVPDTIIQPTTEVEGETVIDEGGNLKVAEGGAGYYQFFFDKSKLVIQKLSFVLRGDAVGGWGEDSNPLTLVSEPEAVEGGIQFTYEVEVAVVEGAFKVKMAAIEAYDGWDVAFGAEGGENFVIETAGTIKITLVTVLDLDTDTFTGEATFVAV